MPFHPMTKQKQREPHRKRHRRTALALQIAGLLSIQLAFCAVWMRNGVTQKYGVIVFADYGVAIGGTLAVAALAWGGLRSRGWQRTGWFLITLGVALWSAGDWYWLFIDLQGVEVPFPSEADIVYLAAYVPLFIGLALLTSPRRSLPEARTLFDGAAVSLSASAALWHLILAPTYGDSESTMMEKMVSAAYPVLDLALVLAVFVIGANSIRTRGGASLSALGMGLLLTCGADMLFAYAALDNIDQYWALTSLAWVAGYLVLAIGGILRAGVADMDATAERKAVGVMQQLAPLALVVEGFAFTAYNPAALEDPVFSLLAGGALFAIVARQVIVVHDNIALNRTLVRSAGEISTRYAAEQAERLRFEALAESLEGGLVTVGADGRVAFCNTGFVKMVGVSADNIVGRTSKVLATLIQWSATRPEEASRKWEAMLAAIKHRPVTEIELGRNSPRTVKCYAFLVQSQAGNELGHGFFLEDISEAKKADRLKDDLIALASHELRTPLTGILGFSELLAGQLGSEPYRGWAQRINTESKRLTTIVDDFLDVSRLSAGRLQLREDDVSFSEVASAAARAVDGTLTENHELVLDFPASEVWLSGDEGKLVQVFANLLSNAIKYSPDGGVIRFAAGVHDGSLRASVSDEGVGIPADRVASIFDRFQRVEEPETRTIRGTGLGLYVVKQLLTQMRGTVSVSSSPGRGSTFTVTLPLANAQRELAEAS